MTHVWVAPGEHLQRKQRTRREYTDQHGRKFWAVADKATSMPISEMSPMGFTPPWMPPQKYAKFAQEGDLHFVWQYETLATEYSDGAQQYYQAAIAFAMEHGKPEPVVGGPVHHTIRMAIGKPPMSPAIPLACEAGDPWLLGVPGAAVNEVMKEVLYQGTGTNNRAALEVIRQSVQNLMRGAPVVPKVELPESVPESALPVKSIHSVDESALTAMLNISYNDFVKQCAGKGKTMPEIAALWKEHKAALKELEAEGAAA